MGYPINLTANSQALITPVITNNGLPDGAIDTSTGITLIGRNYINYGDMQNENFLHLLENFADSIPPTQSLNASIPLTGTIWYDTGTPCLRVYDGVNWSPVSESYTSATPPSATTNTINAGAQWFDTTNQQLNVWTGTSWYTIGPGYSALLGLSGAVVEVIPDASIPPVNHTVVSMYTGGNRSSIFNNGAPFTPNPALPGFLIIATGQTMANGMIISGTATNSQTVGNITPTSFARVDQASTFTSDITVNGNVNLGSANISHTATGVSLTNTAYLGNVDVNVYAANGPVNSVHIDGQTGLVIVSGDPIVSSGVATKNYVDNTATTLVNDIAVAGAQQAANLLIVESQLQANITAANNAIAETNASLISTQNAINAEISTLTATVASEFTAANAHIASLQSTLTTDVSTLQTELGLYAPLNSPTFTGTPTVPEVPAYTSYLASIHSLTYVMEFNTLITTSSGDFITQYTSGGSLVSNVQVSQASANFSQTVRLVSGTVDTSGSNSFVIKQNGSTIVTEVIGFTPSGTAPAYLGLNDTTNGSTGGTSVATTGYVDLTANLMYGDYTQRISTQAATQSTALANLTANVALTHSPALTGTPTAPTPLNSDSSTAIATTMFVANLVTAEATTRSNAITALASVYAPINNPTFTGTPSVPTQSANNSSTAIASTAYVDQSAASLASDYNTKINAEIAARAAAISSAVAPLAPINSPTFTGTPTAPTPTTGDNSTKLATTAFVDTSLATYATISSPTFTGTPRAPTVSSSDNSTAIATTSFVYGAVFTEASARASAISSAVAPLAPINSPTFTGTPTAITQPANSFNSALATTAYVDQASAVLVADYNGKITLEMNQRNAAIAAAITPLAPLASPALTGTPTAPTPTSGDSSTRIATTSFVAAINTALTAEIASASVTYNVSSSAPTGVPTYNFWFQV